MAGALRGDVKVRFWGFQWMGTNAVLRVNNQICWRSSGGRRGKRVNVGAGLEVTCETRRRGGIESDWDAEEQREIMR